MLNTGCFSPHSTRSWIICLMVLLAIFTPSSPEQDSYASGEMMSRKRQVLLADLRQAMEALSMLPPSVVFLGGSRVTGSEPLSHMARETGKLLAQEGIPVSTGGGSGIMEFLTEGFSEGRKPGVKTPPSLRVRHGFSWKAGDDDLRTQGFNMKLPFEQKPNLSIQVSSVFRDMGTRKLALTENKRAFGFFPGGFGTHDEFFEVWDLIACGESSDPLALLGREFWCPEVESLQDAAVTRRTLITPARMEIVTACVTDEPAAFLAFIKGWRRELRGFEADPAMLEKSLASDITRAASAYSRWNDSVVVIGAAHLEKSDPAFTAALKMAAGLAEKGIPLRLATGGVMAKALIESARQKGCPVSAFLTDREIIPGLEAVTVRSIRVHKSFMSEKMLALVVLPGDVHTLSELFGVLCLMQAGILEKKPVILVGKDYWEPLFATYRKIMLSEKRRLIAPQDMDLVTITDDPYRSLLRIPSPRQDFRGCAGAR